MIVSDEGDGMVKVEMDGQSRIIKAEVIKLMNTFFNKSGDKYTMEEMEAMGFRRKQ